MATDWYTWKQSGQSWSGQTDNDHVVDVADRTSDLRDAFLRKPMKCQRFLAAQAVDPLEWSLHHPGILLIFSDVIKGAYQVADAHDVLDIAWPTHDVASANPLSAEDLAELEALVDAAASMNVRGDGEFPHAVYANDDLARAESPIVRLRDLRFEGHSIRRAQTR